MYFEFQLSITMLGAVVRNQLHYQALCYASSFPYQTDTLLINRILVLENTSLRREPAQLVVQTADGTTSVSGSKCVLVQPLQFELVTQADALASGPASAPIKYSPSIELLVDIIAFSDGSTAFLQLSVNGVDFGALGPLADTTTREAIVKALQDGFGTVTRAVDMYALQSLMPGVPLVATNAGATTTSAGDVLVLRVEVNGTADPVGQWTDFYNSYDTNLAGAHDWGLLIDKNLLIAGIKQKLGASLAASSDKFSLDSGPAATWKPSWPGFDIAFSGEVINACTCAWGELDVNVDVSSAVTLSVPTTDVLRTRVHTTYDASDVETFCCALTAGLFWPVVGLIYLSKEKVNFGQYLLGYLAGPVGVFIAVCVIAGNQSVVSNLDATCHKVDDETVQCDQPTTFGFGALGGAYHLEVITGITPGPVLGGSATLAALTDPLVKVTFSEFTWVLRGSCSQGFHSELVGQISLTTATPGSILRLCPVTVLADPAHVFHVSVQSTTITITATLNQEYLGAPYPCQVLAPTNGGVRIITLAPVQEITPERVQELAMQLSIAQSNCNVPIKDWRWSDPDPGPQETQVDWLWQIVVSKMRPGQRVEVLDGGRTVLATATATSRGVAHATVWQGPSQREIALSLLDATGGSVLSRLRRWLGRWLLGQRAAEEGAREVSIRLVQLEPVARFTVQGQLEAVRFDLNGAQPLLGVTTSEGQWLYDVRTPQAPSLLHGPSLTHVGAPAASPSGAVSIQQPTIKATALMGQAMPRRDRFVLRPDDTHLTLHRSDGTTERIRLATLATGPISRVVPATAPGARDAIAVVAASGDTTVYDLGEPNRPRELARYPSRPWFLDAARSRSLLARASADAQWVLLYQVRKTVDV
jgi:hypothetical protein